MTLEEIMDKYDIDDDELVEYLEEHDYKVKEGFEDWELDDFEESDLITYLEKEGWCVTDARDDDARSLARELANAGREYLRDVISELVWCPSNTDVDFMLSKLKEML